jgi:2-oxoisovalerate dehydrogenase E1 component
MPDGIHNISRELALDFYRTMVKIRQTEENLVKLYQSGMILGACHTYIGEEAVATGVCANLTNSDVVFSTHRGHGHAIAKGIPPKAVIAELLGRTTGCSHGRGGSMHLFDPEIGFYGSSGIVGPGILLAAGAGYTSHLLKKGFVGVAFFGDGGSNNGAFYEGLNLAAAYQLPVIFICENNLYATEVPLATVSGNPEIASRAAALGLPGVAVDGNDALAVYCAAKDAVERARQGDGPTLIECKTYRFRAHSEGMRDSGYRTPEEIEAWKQRCPVNTWKERLLASNVAEMGELEAIDREMVSLVNDAVAFAKASPLPDPQTLTDYVFSE